MLYQCKSKFFYNVVIVLKNLHYRKHIQVKKVSMFVVKKKKSARFVKYLLISVFPLIKFEIKLLFYVRRQILQESE